MVESDPGALIIPSFFLHLVCLLWLHFSISFLRQLMSFVGLYIASVASKKEYLLRFNRSNRGLFWFLASL